MMKNFSLDNSVKSKSDQLLRCIALFFCHVSCNAESTVERSPSIQTPGPDLANFPNSAFTLPQGQAYLELSPVNYNSRTCSNAPAQFSSGYFLRYGLADDVELRLLSNGYTWVDDQDKTAGMNAQVFDIKWHIVNEQKDAYLPAMGVEISLQTNWAAGAFKNGLQPALSLNFDQTLPYDLAFEYNLGFTTQQTNDNKTQYQLALSWALQREIVDDFALFVNGYTNTGNGLTSSAVGGGFQWTAAPRLAIFSNLSAGLTSSTAKFAALLGFAIAF